MEQALQGLNVIDMTRVLAGPYSTMLLADMGAEVLKIEMPGKGDDSRAYGPYINGESAYFMSINRNKRSMTLNLKNEDAKEVLIKLIKDADILVENFRPGTMEKLGLGYDTLKDINPGLIYAASSGFGHTGPYSKRPAYDGVVQAMGGIMSITGQKGGRPTRVGPSIGDITAGIFTTVGILAALNYRHKTGKGQKVDVAMLDGQVAILENAVSRYFATGTSPKPAGNAHTSIFPFQPFETNDGEIMIAAGNDNLFRKLWQVFGNESVADDPRFKTNPLRGENFDDMVALITEETKKKSTGEWQQLLDEAGVPNGPINNIEMIVNDPQIKSRDMILEVNHPVAGQTFLPGVPIKMSETQGSIRKAAPVLGEDTDDVLRDLGYTDEEIKRLHNEGAI